MQVGLAISAIPAGTHPTTGLLAVMLADALCNQTELYGFGDARSEPCARYFDEPPHCQGHAQYAGAKLHDVGSEHSYLARRLVEQQAR